MEDLRHMLLLLRSLEPPGFYWTTGSPFVLVCSNNNGAGIHPLDEHIASTQVFAKLYARVVVVDYLTAVDDDVD